MSKPLLLAVLWSTISLTSAFADEVTVNRAVVSRFPRGDGFARDYPGDEGIAADPRLIFADDFESGDFSKWDQHARNPSILSLVADPAADPRMGTKSMKVTATLGENTGGGATIWFEPGDPVFVRYYVKFAPDCDYTHHMVRLRANKGLTGRDKWSGFGQAGTRPQGDERFVTGIEPWGASGRYPPPGRWNFYTYWPEMKQSRDGKYWGNSFIPDDEPDVPRDRWICVEFMVKHNTPGERDGEQAFWIDGELRGHWKGFLWRTSPTLWANSLALESYVTDRWTKNKVNTVYFDNVVIAKEYIGPTALPRQAAEVSVNVPVERDDTARPWAIQGADGSIVSATLSGPRFHAPEVFLGAEDYHNPRIHRLRSEYDFLDAIEGEADEFRWLLKLRHWVHGQWPIDDEQTFSGDAFAILDHARQTGAGFHCAHAMTVQQAVMTAAGYVARNLGIDRDHKKFGRSYHHGINEVWSNDFAKWVAFDAKYDIHFERDGLPLSALEVHEALRRDDGEGVQMVQGIDRRPVPRPEPHEYGGRIDSYWWVSWHIRQNSFTQPHFSGGSSLVICDNQAFREDRWYRGAGESLSEHWAYAAGAFIPVANRHRIEWTPGVTSLARTRQVEPGHLRVEPRSATPNFKEYRCRIDAGPWQALDGGQTIDWRLQEGRNSLEVRTVNLFGVVGSAAVAVVDYKTRTR